MHRVTLSRKETGVRAWTPEELEAAAQLYGKPREELLGGASVADLVSRETIEPENRWAVSRSGPSDGAGTSLAPPRVLRVLQSHAVRVWLAEFRAELTKARATDEEIEEAMRLLISPELFTFYHGGAPREYNEDEVVMGMEAMAKFIRARLKQRGRKIG
jgi:hypothetical protein